MSSYIAYAYLEFMQLMPLCSVLFYLCPLPLILSPILVCFYAHIEHKQLQNVLTTKLALRMTMMTCE